MKSTGESFSGNAPSFGYAEMDDGDVLGVVRAVEAAEKGDRFENGEDVDGVGRLEVGVRGRSFGWISGDMPGISGGCGRWEVVPGMLRFGVILFGDELVLVSQAEAVGSGVGGTVEGGETGAARDICQPRLPTNRFVSASAARVCTRNFVSLCFLRNGSEGRR